jgi:CRISPR-associated endonuclease/helicase Cas3
LTDLKNRLRAKADDTRVRVALDMAGAIIAPLRPAERIDNLLPPFLRQAANRTEAQLSQELFVRMLFSALVDGDFLDTEAHFQPARAGQRSDSPALAELWNRFEADQARLTGQSSGPLQHARHAIYRACLEAAALPPGLFRLIVPTGGGKTRSGMAFALRHALLHGLDRIIVAIPYTSIIEQTADAYRDIFRDEGVLEHHSAVADRDDQASPVTARQQWGRLASENWDAPVVVTTTVQLFESLFANRPARYRKLHNVSRSVLILDEVQTLPPHLLDPILDALAQLVRHYHVTAVLCTATQPALTGHRYLKGLKDVREIVPEPERLFRDPAFRRVTYELPGGEAWSWGRVAGEMRSEGQALAVVNTKKDALALLDALGDDPTALHLSTLMCGAHRAEVLKEVKDRLKRGGPCRLVATQVVEAGVDIDFPMVLRAVGPLDRIVQAAGRCNRNARRPSGRVVVFDPAEGGAPPGAYRVGLDTAAAMLRRGCDLHDPQTYERYFTLFFQGVDLDREKIQECRAVLDYPEVARRFRLIDEDGAPVVVRPAGHEAAVDGLLDIIIRNAAVPPRWAFRRLQRYLVNVRSSQVATYEARGLLQPVAPGLWEWQGGYDPIRGLVDVARAPDLLVI